MSQQQTDAEKCASAIIRIDVDGRVTDVNMTALVAVGCGKEQIVGMHYGCFLILSHLNNNTADSSLCDPVLSCIATGQPIFSVYGMLRTAEGHATPAEIGITPVYRSGEVAEVIFIIEREDLRCDG
jgi:hypothetical protein